MCGAVKAATETPATTSLGPNLDYLLKAIRPAVARAASQPADKRLRVAILENVEETINNLMEQSTVLREFSETKRLMIVGAYYELASGQVHFSEPVRVPPRTSRTSPTLVASAPASNAPAAASAASAHSASTQSASTQPAAAAPAAKVDAHGHAPAPAAAAAPVVAAAKPAAPAAKPAAESAAQAAKAAETVAHGAKPAAPAPAPAPAAKPATASVTTTTAAVKPAGATSGGHTAKPASSGH